MLHQMKEGYLKEYSCTVALIFFTKNYQALIFANLFHPKCEDGEAGQIFQFLPKAL